MCFDCKFKDKPLICNFLEIVDNITSEDISYLYLCHNEENTEEEPCEYMYNYLPAF